MRRFLAGFAFALIVVCAPVALAAGGDTTIKGALFVNGTTQLRSSLEVIGGSAVSDLHADYLNAPRIAITSGGFGYGFLNGQGVEVTRIVAGEFSDPSTFPAPPSSLLLRRNPAQMWFRTDTGWTCLAGCTP